jgi:16S rRNA (guanine527-N7)-methyltransferase
LLDAMTKRVTFLDEVLAWEGAPEHGSAVLSRAEEASRRPELTEAFDLVTSRSFGPPAATAECATRFLKVGGLLIVSEPPEDDSASRWPLEGLRKVALRDLGRHRFGPAFEILEKTGPTPPLYPRPSGSTKKSPLF